MAHFIVEYSANLSADLLDMPGLMRTLHQGAAKTGVFPLAGLRSRAICCDQFRVGDGDANTGFIHLSMKVGQGRAADVRLQLARQLFDLMVAHLQPLLAQQAVAISFEMRELEAQTKFNHRNY